MLTGILGGSFNPIHNTHIELARRVLENLSLDRVLFVPAGNPYHKAGSEMLPAKIRYKMVQEALSSESCLEVSDLDLTVDHATYTVDTLKRARALFPRDEFIFIMGQDAFKTFNKWKHWEKIILEANLAVVSRVEGQKSKLSDLVYDYYPTAIKGQSNNYIIKGAHHIYLINDFDFTVSSIMVRNFYKYDKDYTSLIPSKVSKFINENRYIFDSYWG